jgi:beta-lactamase regulating signal transducer with metallopeptidase domain
MFGDGELWIAERATRWMPWIDALWLGGVLLLSLRAAGGWWQLQVVRGRARALVPAEVESSFRALAAQFEMGHRVALRISNEVVSPMVMGIWHVTVIVPLSAAMSLVPEQLEAVLAHELAHVRRWDYLCNLVQTAVECLFFFHPAMWWVSKRAREFREMCCDQVVARACADPAVYAEALLELEEQRSKRLRMAVALKGDGGSLLNRIRRVMGEKTMEKRTMSGVRIAAAGMVLACLYVVPHVAQGSKIDANSEKSELAPAQAAAVDAETRKTTESLHAARGAGTVEVAVSPGSESGDSIAAATQAAAAPAPVPQPKSGRSNDSSQSGSEFLDGMRSAGYTVDLNKDLDSLIALRSVGVTGDYAKAMAQAGMGTPTLHELVGLKSVGVTPEYIAGMKAAGLAPGSLQQLVGMKSVGVTPEYAKAMASTGLGIPTLHDLIAMKSLGVTPDYLTGMKAAGLGPESLHDAVSMKSVGVTPEYAKGVAQLGLGTATMHDLVAMKSVGVTPEYVAELKSAGLAPGSLHDAISMKSVGVTPEYAKAMASSGFTGLSAHELVSLKAQGVSPDSVKWLKTAFPDADMHAIQQAAAFHIDAAFMEKVKAHGFSITSLDKLVKVKISGLLD